MVPDTVPHGKGRTSTHIRQHILAARIDDLVEDADAQVREEPVDARGPLQRVAHAVVEHRPYTGGTQERRAVRARSLSHAGEVADARRDRTAGSPLGQD